MEKKKTENNEYMNQRRAEYGDANKYGFRAARSIAKNGEKAAAKKKELAKKVKHKEHEQGGYMKKLPNADSASY